MSEFDVVQVNYATKAVTIMATNKSERNADAIIDMAVMRRGIEEGYFTMAPAGRFKDGDTYFPEDEPERFDEIIPEEKW